MSSSRTGDVAAEVALAGHTGDVDTVRRHVSSADERVREVALGALERAGALNEGDVERGLDDAAVRVRRRAAELAASFPGVGPPSLLGPLDDPDPSVVEMACWASGERVPAEPGVVDRLEHLATSHGEALCREAAVAALGSLEQGLSAVLVATTDRPAVRRRAVLALAAFSGPEVDEALEAARHDRDWQVRQAASDVAGEPPETSPSAAV